MLPIHSHLAMNVYFIWKTLVIMVLLCLTTHWQKYVLLCIIWYENGVCLCSLSFISPQGGPWGNRPVLLVSCHSWMFESSVLMVYRLDLDGIIRLLSLLHAVSWQQSSFWMPPSKCEGSVPWAFVHLWYFYCVIIAQKCLMLWVWKSVCGAVSGQYFDRTVILKLRVEEDSF